MDGTTLKMVYTDNNGIIQEASILGDMKLMVTIPWSEEEELEATLLKMLYWLKFPSDRRKAERIR